MESDPQDPAPRASPARGAHAREEARVLHLARLAGLELAPGEARTLGPELERMLAAFQSLRTLALADDEEETGERPIAGTSAPDALRLRADEPEPFDARAALLAAAPEAREGAFVVPRTVGGAGEDESPS